MEKAERITRLRFSFGSLLGVTVNRSAPVRVFWTSLGHPIWREDKTLEKVVMNGIVSKWSQAWKGPVSLLR